MIVGVEGVLEGLGDGWVLVKTGGFILKVAMPSSSVATIGSPGDRVRLHTHLQVREDGLALYGFGAPEELALFELILNVSGAGPKSALSLLATLPPQDLALALTAGDTASLTRAPGIGKKMAERLVLELRGKVDKVLGGAAAVSLVGEAGADALAALTGLGYSVREAAAALAALPPDRALTLEDKVRLALQKMGQP